MKRKTEKKGMNKKKLIDRPAVMLLHLPFSFLVIFDGGALLSAPIEPLMRRTGDAGLAFAGMYLAFAGIWLMAFAYWGIFRHHRPMFRALGPEAKGNHWKTALPLGLAAGLALNLILALIAMVNGDIRLSFAGFHPLYLLLFIVSVGIQSGAEELICRVHLYQQLRRIFPRFPWIAIAGNALIFSLLHLANSGVTVMALLNILLTGILYSMIVYYFDSFWACVIAHTGWNFCQSILLGLPNSGIVSAYSVFRLDASNARDSFAYNVNFGIEGTVTAVVLLAAACAAVFVLGRKRKQPPLDLWKKEPEVPDYRNMAL